MKTKPGLAAVFAKLRVRCCARRHGEHEVTSRGVTFVSLVALLISNVAFAGFNVVQPPKAAVVASAEPRAGYQPLQGSPEFGAVSTQASDLTAVRFIGAPSGAIEVRRGMGRDMRLADALRLIAPAGWRGFGKAEIAGTFDGEKKVSWKGGRPWTSVLEDLARSENLSIDVDWNARRLYVGKRAAKPAPALARVAPVPPPAPVWSAKQGSTVRTTVEDWAQKAGWTLVWPMPDLDYRIVAPLSFSGSIVDATGRITKLYERAERPLAVDIHLNQKVIVFSEKGVASP